MPKLPFAQLLCSQLFAALQFSKPLMPRKRSILRGLQSTGDIPAFLSSHRDFPESFLLFSGVLI